MLEKLNISAPDTADTADTSNTDEETNSSTNENVTMEAFHKSVVIDEASNTIKEFIATSMREDDTPLVINNIEEVNCEES